MRSWAGVAGALVTVVVGVGSFSLTPVQKTGPAAAASAAPGSEACSGCHAEIYQSYQKTVMANASGAAIDGVITGEFRDQISGVRYKVYKQDEPDRVSPSASAVSASLSASPADKSMLGTSAAGSSSASSPSPSSPLPSSSSPNSSSPSSGSENQISAGTQGQTIWMSYERESEKFRGQRELLYFIGSGRKGRSYLFSDRGFLFETPINWYSQEGRWGMTPAYADAREIPMNLPAFVDCLNCHSSEVQAPIAGTENKFSGAPFLHGGITCERCHGTSEGHGGKAKGAGSSGSSLVNPAKLPADRRDAICMECHFEGAVAVQQPGKELYRFQPGEKLSDYIHYFLLSGNEPQKPQALSQMEALSLSECKRKSGDKMWCGSCHDPHAEPAAEEKAAYYRGKCLSCHGEAFGAKHHPDKADCTKCHMPALPSKDVAHTEGTDHRILRYPNAMPLPRLEVRGTPGAPLVPFPKSDTALATTRDFALAWETLAQRNSVLGAAQRAEQYLSEAVKQWPDDPVVLSAWGFVEQRHGQEKVARESYEQALKIDPLSNDAATDLGIMEARAGNLRRAVELWQGAFERAPYRSAIGMNLAIVFCASGQKDAARRYVERVLEFNPDYLKGKQLLAHLGEEPVQCRP